MGDSASDRALARAGAVASLIALGALFWPIVLRRLFVYADLGNAFIPLRMFLAENLARGVTPLWMPNLFCGFYAHGEGQIGIFHPLRWLLYEFLPFTEAFNLECLLPYPLALCGMAVFLRRLALPASAAIFGGATFAFSAYLSLRLTHPNAVAVIAHLGWLLAALDVLLREPGRARQRAWIGVALLTCSQALVGYPPAIVYCWVIAVPYALYVAASRRVLVPLAAAAGAFGVGILLGAIQLVPTFEAWTSSDRAAPSFEFLTGQSLDPRNLPMIFAPWLFRALLYSDDVNDPVEQVVYFGPVVPIAVIWVLLGWKRLGRLGPLVAGLLGLSIVALVLALGAHTSLYTWLTRLPLLGALRVPARHSLVLYFAGAVLAAIAFADLQSAGTAPQPWRRIASIWLAPAASCGVVFVLGAQFRGLVGPTVRFASPALIAVAPISFALAAGLFTAAARGHRTALHALLPLVLADQGAYAASLWWSEPARTLTDYRAGIAQPPTDPPQRVATWLPVHDFHTRDGEWHLWASTVFVVHDARLVSGYLGLVPAKQLDYASAASLRVAGATTKLSPNPRTQSTARFESLSGALPRARMVTGAVISSQPAVDIEAIDVAKTALVEAPLALEPGPAGVAAIEQDLPGAIRIAVQGPTRQLLVLSESYHAGWQADVDGAEAHVLRVNGDFMGVVVQPGAHVVSLSFAPRSFALGCWTSLAGLAIVLAVGLVGQTRPAQSHRGEPAEVGARIHTLCFARPGLTTQEPRAWNSEARASAISNASSRS